MPKIAIAHLASITPDGIEELDNIGADWMDQEHLHRHRTQEHRQRRAALRTTRAARRDDRIPSPTAVGVVGN